MRERSEATRLLLAYWGGKPIPVDPTVIARNEGVVVRYGLPHELQGASGWYRHEPDGSRLILYNAGDGLTRQRFTIAHELGHHVLGHGPRPRDTNAAFFNPYDPVETEANRFAAEILMPVFAVKTLIENSGVTSISALAGAFQVSEPAMTYRLKNLGYLQ